MPWGLPTPGWRYPGGGRGHTNRAPNRKNHKHISKILLLSEGHKGLREWAPPPHSRGGGIMRSAERGKYGEIVRKNAIMRKFAELCEKMRTAPFPPFAGVRDSGRSHFPAPFPGLGGGGGRCLEREATARGATRCSQRPTGGSAAASAAPVRAEGTGSRPRSTFIELFTGNSSRNGAGPLPWGRIWWVHGGGGGTHPHHFIMLSLADRVGGGGAISFLWVRWGFPKL